ncbi:hypothetical protein ACNAN0_02955 [Agrilactobacillus fermenti]|uniref:hypothetical protein n=1 Tax=Agrilactobacillus fermenti TaxID=2586909 RepID=UPI001E418306|nr:hypothetical protein [Agrilactobacillus fermenti]MCD2255542.1 hypothetical protein [Agrilactobacillus fermenti]
MTKDELQHRLKQELYTICDHYDVEMDDRLYTEAQYQDLKRTLLVMNELGMDQNKLNQLLAIGA